MTTKDEKKTTSEKPVSLNPLNLREALDALLKVKPKPKEKKKRTRKTETKKSSD
jgi:hypothetical protein